MHHFLRPIWLWWARLYMRFLMREIARCETSISMVQYQAPELLPCFVAERKRLFLKVCGLQAQINEEERMRDESEQW